MSIETIKLAPTQAATPKQHSANTAKSNDLNETVDTFVTVVHSLNHVTIIGASLHHPNNFKLVLEHLVVSDAGANGHVAGCAWLPLFHPNGPCVNSCTITDDLTSHPNCNKTPPTLLFSSTLLLLFCTGTANNDEARNLVLMIECLKIDDNFL